MSDVYKTIQKLKEEINAVILVHNYQPSEIQDIADFRGDSLDLSRKAASTDKEVIVFCGVDFMAETAKILSPEKKVILPVSEATCPMANMITPDELAEFKKEYPGATVVSYVNTTAAVKAISDICCTSSNAIDIVKSVSTDQIIFTPDRNLADYVSRNVDKEIISWPGFCPVHDSISAQEIIKTKERNPGSIFMAHPECRPEVLELADYVASTSGMFKIVEEDAGKKFIVGTEEGIIYPLKQRFPDREFIPAVQGMICPNMKKMSLDKVVKSMKDLSPQVELPTDIIQRASIALKRMLESGQGNEDKPSY